MHVYVALVIFLPRIQAVYLLQQGLVGTVEMRKWREQGRAVGARGYVEESRERADPLAMYFRAEALFLLVRNVIGIGGEFVSETREKIICVVIFNRFAIFQQKTIYNSCDRYLFAIIILSDSRL